MIGGERPLVVTFGEMLLRLSPGKGARLFESERMRAGFGGAEANVAVSLAHFDVWCEYITRLPDNLIGDAAIAALRAEGVQTNFVARGPERMGLYFTEPGADVGNSRTVYDRDGSAFAGIAPGMIDWVGVLSEAVWLHVTGITAALAEGPVATLGAALAAARSHGVPVSLDLNYRPALWRDRDPVPVMRPLVQGVDLLIANVHSIRAMLGIDLPDDALATTAGALAVAQQITAQVGCRRIALTQREVFGTRENRWNATLYDATTGELVAGRPWTVRVVDRIGGGDAFAAALIASLLQGRGLAAAVEFSLAASALKLRIPGDFNRVTTGDVDQFVQGMHAAGVKAARTQPRS